MSLSLVFETIGAPGVVWTYAGEQPITGKSGEASNVVLTSDRPVTVTAVNATLESGEQCLSSVELVDQVPTEDNSLTLRCVHGTTGKGQYLITLTV